MQFSGTLEGVPQMKAALDNLSKQIANRSARRALRAGGFVLSNDLKRTANGTIGGRVEMKVKTHRKKGPMVWVGIRDRNFPRRPWFVAFWNYGHHLGKRIATAAYHLYDKAGKKRTYTSKASGRFVQGSHWMDSAFKESGAAVQQVILETLADELNQLAKEAKTLK